MNPVLIVLIALNTGVDPTLLKAICYKETKLQNINHYSDGHSTSYGVCQVKIVTAKQIGLGKTDLTKPENNIRVAAKYLAYNLQRCPSKRSAIAAYNTGRCIVPKPGGYVDDVLKLEEHFRREL